MYDISYPGIVNWNTHVMEKLGYMVLAYNHGHIDATESYKNCITNLIKAIGENMLVNGTSEDRMDDYHKMMRNLEILQQFCDKNFINIPSNFTLVQQNNNEIINSLIEKNNLERGKKEKNVKKEKNIKKEKKVKKY